MKFTHHTGKKEISIDCQGSKCIVTVSIDGVEHEVGKINQKITHIDTRKGDGIISLYNANKDKDGNLKAYYLLYTDSATLMNMTHTKSCRMKLRIESKNYNCIAEPSTIKEALEILGLKYHEIRKELSNSSNWGITYSCNNGIYNFNLVAEK